MTTDLKLHKGHWWSTLDLVLHLLISRIPADKMLAKVHLEKIAKSPSCHLVECWVNRVYIHLAQT